jgi:hypothetical protein
VRPTDLVVPILLKELLVFGLERVEAAFLFKQNFELREVEVANITRTLSRQILATP